MDDRLPSRARFADPAARRRLRLVAAALSAACAVVYFAIGAGAIYPAEGNANRLLVFGALAGSAFLLGAVLLATTDRRPVLALGALFQVFVIVMYVLVARDRDPAFEIWGISLKIAQAAILGVLLALLAAPRTAREREGRRTAG